MTTKTAAHQLIQFSNLSLNQTTQQMIVADGVSDNIRELVKDAHAPVFLVEQTSHPLQVITTALAGERLQTLHIVAHGQSGEFQIGGQVIDERVLRLAAALLAQWQVDEILLWSCQVGRDAGFVKTLADLTGSQVYVDQITLNSKESLVSCKSELTDYRSYRLSHIVCFLSSIPFCDIGSN